jgi:hypothetical protein
MTGTRGSLAAAFVGVVAIFATSAAVFALRTGRHAVMPDDASLASAAKIVARDLQKGDAIGFHPEWSASQKWRFAESYRTAGLKYDDALIAGDPTDLWDADGFKRLWVVSTHNRAATLKLPAHRIRDEDLDHGTALLLYDLGTSRTAYDLRKHLADAVVTRRQADGSMKPCIWNGESKHICGGDWWLDVVDQLHEVGNSRHMGMMVQPGARNGLARLTWPRPTPARVLAGRVGLRLWAVRNDVGSDVKVRALVGEREVWSIVLQKADFTWHAFEVRLQAEDAGKPVAFEFAAEDGNWRQTVLDARLLDATGAPVATAPPLVVPTAAPLAVPGHGPALAAPEQDDDETAPPHKKKHKRGKKH